MSKLISGIMSYILPPSNDLFYSLFEEGTKYCKQAAELFNEIIEEGMLLWHMKHHLQLQK